jgi:hypothetical protein
VIEQQKHRREFGRWVLMLGLYNAKPIGAWEELLLSILQGMWPDATRREVQLALDYLSDRKLIDLKKEPSGRWFADLNRYGVDVVEYTVPCEPGIARPDKYT